ncbi:hypothetical protein AZE42_13173, partial [Rhizopogon vesiculosus]
FAIRSIRFIDAYQKGLSGAQAAWAIKKYRGHHVLPPSIMEELDLDCTSPTPSSSVAQLEAAGMTV